MEPELKISELKANVFKAFTNPQECPHCGISDVEITEVKLSQPVMQIKSVCHKCKAEWSVSYFAYDALFTEGDQQALLSRPESALKKYMDKKLELTVYKKNP